MSHPLRSLLSNEAPREGWDMKIDCTQCEMYRSDHCQDCLVTALLHPPEVQLDIDEDLDPSLQALSGAGLIPVLKFRQRPATDPRSSGATSPQNKSRRAESA